MSARKANPFVLSEHQEQVALFQWAAMQSGRYPELKLLFAIPNGGARHIAVAKKLSAEGVKPGVPDVCLPVARHGFHALWIEMKRQHGGRLTREQGDWIVWLTGAGNKVAVCKGCEPAIKVIEGYLKA